MELTKQLLMHWRRPLLQEEESSICKEQEEAEDKQEARNSTHWLTRAGATYSCHTRRILPVGFFDKVTINMTSCYKMEDKENGDEEKQEKSWEDDDKTLTLLEALSACIDWRQIFNLPEEVHQHVVVALHHPELYADKVKDVGPSMKMLLSMPLAMQPSLFLTMIYY